MPLAVAAVVSLVQELLNNLLPDEAIARGKPLGEPPASPITDNPPEGPG
jgi:hypothetical protein